MFNNEPKDNLSDIVAIFNRRLLLFVEEIKDSNTTEDLKKAMIYSIYPGGKAIRACLLLAVCQDGKGNEDIALELALALEMVHNYSLIHDDLPCMDDSDYRRNRLSCHKKFGEATALMVGNALLTIAFDIVARNELLDDSIKCSIVQSIASVSGFCGILKGQLLDMNAADYDILEIIDYKTGKMFILACYLGGLCCGANSDTLSALERLGRNIGRIFQIIDDLDDYKNDKKTVNIYHRMATEDIENMVLDLRDTSLEILQKMYGSNSQLYNFFCYLVRMFDSKTKLMVNHI